MSRYFIRFAKPRNTRKNVLGHFQRAVLWRICKAIREGKNIEVDIGDALKTRGSGERMHTYNDLEARGFLTIKRSIQGMEPRPTRKAWSVYDGDEEVTVAKKPPSGWHKNRRGRQPLNRAA